MKCVCRSFKCYLGQYVDAYGHTQAGVEVLPTTLAAHKLADRVQQARSNDSNQRRISAANAPYSPAGQDGLISAISHLNLTRNIPLPLGSHGSIQTVDGSTGPQTDQT